MEQFKAVEKEMKTKAYSKEGLSAGGRLDPREKDKMDMCEFLSNCVEEIQRKIESFEAEEETLHIQLKKSKKDSSKSNRLADIEHLTERHKWHLNKLELLLRSVENGNVDVNDVLPAKDSIKYYVEDGHNVDYSGEDETLYDDLDLGGDAEAQFGLSADNDHGSSQDAQSAHEEEVGGAAAESAKTKSKPEAQRRPSGQMKSPLPVLATLHPAGSSTSTTSMKPAPPPARQPGETLKYASAAAAAAASDKNGVGIAPLPPPAGASPAISHAAPSRTPAAASPSPAVSQPVSRVISDDHGPRPRTPSQAPVQTPAPAPVTAAAAPMDGPTAKIAEVAARQQSPAHTPTTNGDKEETEPVEPIFHLPPGLQDLVQSFEATKSRAASTNPPPPSVQRLITASLATIPEPLDAEKPRHYKPQNPFNTPLYYPQEPISVFDDPRLYDTGRIDTDTLFYLFYYRQGTYQQYLAAQALKNQSWRFHKQYQTWFQRHEEPKTITEEFEQGTYRFFDYESTW